MTQQVTSLCAPDKNPMFSSHPSSEARSFVVPVRSLICSGKASYRKPLRLVSTLLWRLIQETRGTSTVTKRRGASSETKEALPTAHYLACLQILNVLV